jgi:putative tryptophan/tyrosine transport system substrate-binding protein
MNIRAKSWIVAAAGGIGLLFGIPIASADPVKIGIAEFGRHPQLDLVVDAFKAGLAAEGFKEGDQVEYELEQVNFDPALIAQMIAKLKSVHPRLILTITTPVSQGAKTALQGSGIAGVFAAVTDPVKASLVPSWEGGDPTMTGASDLQDIDGVFTFMRQLLPNAKRLGLPYNPGEDNDIAVLKLAREAAPRYGFEVVEVGAETANDLPIRIASLKGKADVIYVMTSNLLQPAEPAIASVSNQLNIPVVSANDANVRAGNFLASFSVNYAKVGENAAKIAARILKGEKPETIRVAVPGYGDHAPVINGAQLRKYQVVLPTNLANCACIVE